MQRLADPQYGWDRLAGRVAIDARHRLPSAPPKAVNQVRGRRGNTPLPSWQLTLAIAKRDTTDRSPLRILGLYITIPGEVTAMWMTPPASG